MGCCGSSATSPGPSHMSFNATPGEVHPAVPAPWRVTYRDGSVQWFTDQLVAYGYAGADGGAVDYVAAGSSGAGVSP